MTSPRRLHLISGLPRSGSTLLAAILRQNPSFRAGVESPLAVLIASMVRAMSEHESAMFLTDGQRRRILTGILSTYYDECNEATLHFDTNRAWCAQLALVASIAPSTRVICCLRNPAWILDSMERMVQANPLVASRVFGHDLGTVYSRVELMATKHFLAPALNGLRQAWFSESASRLIAVRYDSLVSNPAHVLGEIYMHLGERAFTHDFERVEYDEPQFDLALGLPGLHRVSGPVRPRPRQTILPTDLFDLYDREFWSGEGANPRQVTVL
jgi:sulfotransferase